MKKIKHEHAAISLSPIASGGYIYPLAGDVFRQLDETLRLHWLTSNAGEFIALQSIGTADWVIF